MIQKSIKISKEQLKQAKRQIYKPKQINETKKANASGKLTNKKAN